MGPHNCRRPPKEVYQIFAILVKFPIKLYNFVAHYEDWGRSREPATHINLSFVHRPNSQLNELSPNFSLLMKWHTQKSKWIFTVTSFKSIGSKGWIKMQLRQSEAHLSINHFQKCIRNDYLDPYDAGEMIQFSYVKLWSLPREWICFDSKTLLDYLIITLVKHLKTDLAEIRQLSRKLHQFKKPHITYADSGNMTNFGPWASWSLPQEWKLFGINRR